MKYRSVSMPVETREWAHGRYAIRQDVACVDELRRFVTEQVFEKLDSEFEKHIVYRRHRKFEFPHPFGDGDVIMKISWPNPEKYSWHRRLQLALKQRYFEDYCETAFYGALALEDVGIPTHKVLGFWTRKQSAMCTESYLLYEKVVADGTGHDLMVKCLETEATDFDRQRFSEFLQGMARQVARLHAADLRHGDIADHNFLVRFDVPDASINCPHTLYMIDTDCVHESKPGSVKKKRRRDIRDWRIIDLDAKRLQQVLKDYLADDYDEKWWKLLQYYRSGWYRPLRTIRYTLKGKPFKDPYHLND